MSPNVRRAAAAALLPLVAACGTVTQQAPATSSAPASTSAAAGGTYPMTIRNCGRTYTVAAPPQRIASLYPGQTEILLRLGVGERIVAQAQEAVSEPVPDLAEQLRAIPSLSAKTPPTREALIATSPDFVYSGSEFEFNAEQGFAGKDELVKAGATPYVATAGCLKRRSSGTVEDTFADLRILGAVLGRKSQAAALEREARAELKSVANRVGDRTPVRTAQVYFEGGKLYAIGASIETDMLRLGGGSNVFAATEERFSDFYAAEVNPEVILSRNPDAFVFAVQNADHARQTTDFLRRTFPGTAAVRENRLVGVRNTTMAPGSLAAIEGVRTIAAGLHPER
ncbi:ABC transporter substrate-binding protein [Actinopolymorpha alba]|uniref:ABC transporter substrate-binding protein n=1 Tax=Actinopolymorpha alba TaxID=533267 RepID=UPI00037507E6|nr:ABC transporter substrate-binding protein [Actinopolymorpha alba]